MHPQHFLGKFISSFSQMRKLRLDPSDLPKVVIVSKYTVGGIGNEYLNFRAHRYNALGMFLVLSLASG